MVNTALTAYSTIKARQLLLFTGRVIAFLILLPSTSSAKVQAFLNQNTAYTDEPITLTLETSDNTNDNPDLSPLEKDFRIIGTSNRSQMRNINGKTSFKKSWIVQLQPLRQGKINIPAISVGNEQTQALTVTINDAPAERATATKEHVFVEAAITLKNDKLPYVQQQISYTVKLFYDEQLLEYEMYPPTLKNAVIEQLQQKDTYRLSRNGKNYKVIERNYVISAEKSGQLTIPPTIIKGNIRAEKKQPQAQQRQQDPFGMGIFSGSMFGEPSKAVTLRTQPIEVDVQPLPDTFKGDSWLPAEDVILKDSWQNQLPIFRVGEPVTRTLSIEAKGLASSQIPKLVLPPIDTIRTYPDQEDNKNYTDGTTLIGLSAQAISYIPNKAGTLQLPEITLDWWNIETKQQQTTRLPAITITIKAGSGTPPKTPHSPNTVQNSTTHSVLAEKPTTENISDTSDNTSFLFLASILTGLAVIGFALFKNKTILLKQYHQLVNPHKDLSQKKLLQHLQQACEENNAQRAAQYLLQWAQQQWLENKPHNIGTLADQLEVGANIVRQLNHSLYAANNTVWKGDELWQLVGTGLQRKQKGRKPNSEGLNTLYPIR